MQKEDNFSKLQQFYLSIWDNRQQINHWGKRYVICFETGAKLYREKYRTNWACYSHILRKEKYPEYKMCDWNIKIVNPQSHYMYENFAEKAPKQYEEYKKLLNLHKKGEL